LAIQFKYNKTSLHELGKQLKIRESALPTLKSKESALRLEVKKTRNLVEEYEGKMTRRLAEIESMQKLWTEFRPGLVRLKKVDYQVRSMAGVKIPVMGELEFEVEDFSLFNNPAWFSDGIEILMELTRLQLQKNVYERSMHLLEYARKKTSQKVNLYEKVQIPGYKTAINKIKRYLEDEENLSKSAQKILKRMNEEKERQRA
jgi:V/A-type H+-transporting ATPase subunit D